MTLKPKLGLILSLGLSASLLACSSDFDPYNELSGFRVLAIRATEPAIAPGQTALLDALIYNETGEPVEYAWSWCPLAGGAESGFSCAFTREELQAGLDQAIGGGVVEIPPYELSRTASAAFVYDLPPAVFMGLCRAIGAQGSLPTFVELPDCTRSFPISIRLETRSGDQSIVAVKTLELLYDETGPRNRNPGLTAVALRPADAPAEVAAPIDPANPPVLARDKEYSLIVTTSTDASEAYVDMRKDEPPRDRRENLVITWFIEDGETDSQRTTFIDGEISLEEATENTWRTPKRGNFPATSSRLFFVIRDGRGGVGWLERPVRLEE